MCPVLYLVLTGGYVGVDFRLHTLFLLVYFTYYPREKKNSSVDQQVYIVN